MSFSDDIEKFIKKTNSSMEEVSRDIPIKLFTGVIKDTRVVTGRLRGNWQTTIGKPASGTLIRVDKTGVVTTEKMIKKVKSFSVVFLTNNLPYAEVLEEQDGMIAKNMRRLQRNIKEVIRT